MLQGTVIYCVEVEYEYTTNCHISSYKNYWSEEILLKVSRNNYDVRQKLIQVILYIKLNDVVFPKLSHKGIMAFHFLLIKKSQLFDNRRLD